MIYFPNIALKPFGHELTLEQGQTNRFLKTKKVIHKKQFTKVFEDSSR